MRIFLLSVIAALALAGTAQADSVVFGCGGTPFDGQSFPEPRSCHQTQSWWMDISKMGGVVPALPPANFATDSTHVHLTVPFPIGEQLVIPASGTYTWPYYAQFHNGVGGTVRQVRGGQFQMGPCCTNDPGYKSVPITSVDQTHTGTITIPANEVAAWRSTSGKKENRFTADTTSPFRGNRQYQSGAGNTFLNAPGAPVGITARGWYQGIGYTNVTAKDSNIGTGVGFRASEMASTCAPAMVTYTYALAEGATHASLLIDPDLHHGDKGIVIAENKPGTSGTFTFAASGLTTGVHTALIYATERASNGFGAGVLPLKFKVC